MRFPVLPVNACSVIDERSSGRIRSCLFIHSHTGNIVHTVVFDPVIGGQASQKILIYLSLPLKDDIALFMLVGKSPIKQGYSGSPGKISLVVFGSLANLLRWAGQGYMYILHPDNPFLHRAYSFIFHRKQHLVPISWVSKRTIYQLYPNSLGKCTLMRYTGAAVHLH